MKNHTYSKTIRWSFPLMVIALWVAGSVPVDSSARPQDDTRGMRIKKRIEESRPAAGTPETPGTAVDSQQPRIYKSTGGTASSSDVRASGTGSEAIIGVTLWRLRPSTAGDNKGARILEQKAGNSAEWVPERIESATRINEGERVRASVESPSTGYLYVIDREQYADGSLGDAYLIFPSTHTRGGHNAVVAGRVIEFPAQEDNPPYFTLTRGRADQVAEVLILIVSTQLLADLPLSATPVKVPNEKLARWEKEWDGKAEQFELEGGAGRPYTREEKAAGSDGSRMLTQADPLPQTILKVNGRPGTPVLVKVALQIARAPR